MRTFPTPFKFADVSPIFKSDDNMNKVNPRPVSILHILSKLYEGTLNDQMLDHIREIYDVLLSAYRRHHSCQRILLKFVEDVKSTMDGGIKMGTVFMDLSKALDCLPHGLLIAKPYGYIHIESGQAVERSLSYPDIWIPNPKVFFITLLLPVILITA